MGKIIDRTRMRQRRAMQRAFERELHREHQEYFHGRASRIDADLSSAPTAKPGITRRIVCALFGVHHG